MLDKTDTKELVVAHYKEDLSWLNSLPLFPRTIYHKSGEFPDKYYEVGGVHYYLPNTGNEAHTYLYHIANNYDDLADVTFFVQGRYDDHAPDLLRFLSGERELNSNGYTTICAWDTATSDSMGMPHHPGLRVGEFYKEIFGEELNEILVFGAGAEFAATKEAIQRRPKEFYKKCLSLFGSDSYKELPMVFERIWHRIFE